MPQQLATPESTLRLNRDKIIEDNLKVINDARIFFKKPPLTLEEYKIHIDNLVNKEKESEGTI